MRLRPTIWIFVCALILAGVWFFLRVAERRPAGKSAVAPSGSAAVAAAGGQKTSVVAKPPAAALKAGTLAKTNQFPYRLSNTAESIGELMNDPHAILLENAFIDTSKPLNLAIPKNLQAPGNPGAYIVQAHGMIDSAFRALLARAGAQVVSYIPNDAYLVTLSAGAAADLTASGFSVLPYEPYYKAPPSLLQVISEGQPQVINELQVAAYPNIAAETEAALEKAGLRIAGQYASPFGEVFTVQNVRDAAALARMPEVQRIEPTYRRSLANDLSRQTLGVSVDSITQSNYMNLSGSNVLVEVDDTGVDTNHPDFLTGGPGTPLRVFFNDPANGYDTDGHGTFVAGEIAGDGYESMTVTNAQGSIMPATNGQFRGKAPLADMLAMNLNDSDFDLQETAALSNAPISNNSWVYNGDGTYDLAAASYDAATRDALPGVTGSQPVLFVFSAGNDGNGDDSSDPGGGYADTIQSPATAKDVITVGAIQEDRDITNQVTNADGSVSTPWQPETSTGYRVAGFSSRGNVGIGTEGTYGRFKPDVVSPGTFIISTRSQEWDEQAYYYENPLNDDQQEYDDVVVGPDSLWANAFPFVPTNAIQVSITIGPSADSPDLYSTNLSIWVGLETDTGYPYFTTSNVFSMPPDDPGLPAVFSSESFVGFNYGISNSTAGPVTFDLITDIITTNNVGNEEEVLSNLNDSLDGDMPPHYYRYESGTSMSAADISGVLALMEDYFINHTAETNPSPALLKALLINGAHPTGFYNYQVDNTINYEGWGLPNLPDSLPLGITNQLGVPCGSFFQDQSPTNALATGDSCTFLVNTGTNPPTQSLRVTLAWTDPPGNPAAAIKLVNSLDLVVTNLDDPTNPVVYFGNDIPASSDFNEGEDADSLTNGLPVDTINNVQNVYLPPGAGTNFSVTVVGREVNVNAVTAQTNNYAGVFAPNIVQDYALVISCGTNAITVTDASGVISNPTGDQNITVVTNNNVPLLNQFVGASSPLLGTNTIPTGPTTAFGTNAAVTIGQTNQWHFYIVQNNTNFANAAFVTFLPDTLAIPRMGVLADSDADSTRPEADIDLFVSTDPMLTNLDPVVISNCVNGTQIGASASGVFNGSSLSRGGTEFVVDTNSAQGQVYYVGVQSEDQMASEYDFLSVFSQNPFSQNGTNGQVVYGVPVPAAIPDGSPKLPGSAYVFALALFPMEVQNVIVTNEIEHQNIGDLIGTLSFNDKSVVLNNHDSIGNPPGPYTFVYDDSQSPLPGSQPSDGPGSLTTFTGQQAVGAWLLTETDDSLTQTGSVESFSMLIQPHLNPQKGVNVTIQPGSWYYNYVDVPTGYTNLSVFATNLPPTVSPPLQLYLNDGTEPNFTNYLFETDLTNFPPGLAIDPGNSISYGPPLQSGTYWIGIYNPSSVPANVYLIATLNGAASSPQTDFEANGPPILDDAVTTSTIYVPATNLITSVNVGMVVKDPRISDLAFTLVSPTGQRVLLMENRGGYDTNGAGSEFLYTNVINSTATGGAAANTNYLPVDPAGETVPITYNFYTVPDEMTIYDGSDPTNFYIGSPTFLYDTGFTNNPPLPGGGGDENTQPETIDVTSQPGYTNITIIMNEFGNPYSAGGDAWTYTAGAQLTNFQYLVFTEDTNLTTTPIKFAVPPFSFTGMATNYDLSDFELATNGDYLAPTNIYDAFGGWSMRTNELVGTNLVPWTNNMVTVVSDPADSLGDNVGSNFLALADGSITRSIATVPNRLYNVTFWYRGPGIAGWWRGEGNATDSSDPENNGNNGSLIGQFDFPAGEVGQAFQFVNPYGPYEFAGTNAYVQIRQSPTLDVGAGGGFTVEGWINPTNVAFQQPLVEWLAKVPTNTADTNFNLVAGPFLDPATEHYYYLLGATNWMISEQWAQSLGGHLATVDTANEENWIYDTFANYAGTNRGALWIGLNDAANPGTFVYSSGLTNVTYTDWATGQPDECNGNEHYVAIVTATNALSGLWVVADNNGVSCTTPATNTAYGVVEVDDLQTNGVQLWISVTNTPGTTNSLVSSNGCLYADLVDMSNVTHEIYSAPGLIQSNVYQHVALTYSTNSGIANLYYDGTNVASTNLGVFVPKTGGDVLLGRDMNIESNNFYAGEMDEMSIYSRALSDAEILAIYQVSAFSTNRNIGKFDPTVTPAEGLAEAQVDFGGDTNVIYGQNKDWEVNSYTFTATSNSMPFQITGLEPGMLLDSFNVSETPLGNLYYLPEQSLDELDGENPYGTWALEIWDSRTGAYLTNGNELVNWQLQFVLQTNELASPLATVPQQPTTITVPPGQTVYLSVAVPTWATFATNVLVSATAPVNMYFNQTTTPTGTVPPDTQLLTDSTGGIGLPILSANPPSAPPLLPGQTYYLGVSNPGVHAVTAVVEVDYGITTLTNGVPFTGAPGALNATNSVRYFAFNVSSNAYEATFQLLNLSGNADLVVRKGPPLPTLYSDDYGSFNATNADENIYVLTNSSPVPLSAGAWYLGVFDRDSGPVNYTVLAKELDTTNGMNGYTVIDLTNGVPFNYTTGPGAALTNFFRFVVTNTVTSTVTNYVGSIHFELYNLTGNGDLTVQTDAPPFAPPFFQSSQQPGTLPELIYISTNSVLTNLAADWYLGVPNNATVPINFTIEAVIDTNAYFPAFPGATGSGGGAVGAGHAGTSNWVYHVISMDDSGPGTLRDAISGPNRTVVFDVSGVVGLLSPLVITNSYLTIAGQTAPGDGITVAGQMTVVTNVHDVIIRDVQFCTGAGGGTLSNSFEGINPANYTNGQVVTGWTVLTNQVSVVTDPTNAYQGSNFLALANGIISNTLPTTAGNVYTLTFAYRGPGIAAWWRGEDNANDSINGNNGTPMNGITYTNGEVGQAFVFNHQPYGSYIPVPASSSLNVGTGAGITIDAWVKADAYNADVFGGPIIEWDSSTSSDLADGCELWSGNQLFCNIRDTSGNGHVFYFNYLSSTNNFQHMAMTYDKNSELGVLYINGTNVASVNIGSFTPQTTYPVNIGQRTGQPNGAGDTFGGVIDELSVYNRALSASEIGAIYQDGTNGKFDPNAPIPQNLAEASGKVGAMNFSISGENTNWQVETITFTATQNGTPLEISGLEPGMLLDSFSLQMTNIVNPGAPLQLDTVSNVIADHISAIWSTNEDLSVLDSTNVTVQWSVLADSLYANNGSPGYGSRLRYGCGDLSFNHNLYADNYNASPRLGDNLSLDFVNNVIYDWGTNAGFSTNESTVDDPSGFTNELNYVCNYLIAGTNSALKGIAFWGGSTNTWIFQTNNFIDSNTNGILDGANSGWNMFTNQFTEFSHPFQLVPVPTDEAFLAYEKVLDFAGPDMDKRDSADSNIVEHVRTQTGTLINAAGTPPARSSLLPYLDTDQDGIPDFWEITFGTDPYTPNPNAAIDGSGYTELEEYDNWLAGPHALTITNTPVGVDLIRLFGKTGNLSFSVTNAINGTVYLTNVWGSVTNTGAYSNNFAVFTPTNNPIDAPTNFSGYASFDVFATNNDTVAYFGPVTVGVVVSAVPVAINSNMPPVIITLNPGQLDPTNYGGSDFYEFTVTNNAAGSNAVAVLFTVTNASGPVDLLANYGLPLPSLSSYDYISTNSWTTSENIVVTPNSSPVPLTNGDWYLAVVNVAGSNVTYDIEATTLYNVSPPIFYSPTNGDFFTNLETAPFTVTCQATDPNTPSLPLTYAVVTNVSQPNLLGVQDTNVMTINPNTGVISWTPDEAQGPTTNSVAVSVSNGAFSVTNSFTIIVEESNLPPVLPFIPNQIVVAPNTLVVTNTATDPDIPTNPLTYTLTSTVPGANVPVIDTNGIITWTPTMADIGSNYLFTTVVTDTNQWAVNAKSLSATNSFMVTVLPTLVGGQPQTNTVPAGDINWYVVSVPTNAIAATNLLLFATNLPVNVWFSTNVPPTITNPNDFDLMPGATNGVSVLTINSSPTNIIPGGVYFLGVQNTNGITVNYAVAVDFRLSNSISVTTNSIFISSIVYTNISGKNGFLLTWFAPTGDIFQVQWTPGLAPTGWQTFSNIIAYDVFISPTNSQFNFFDDGSQTGGTFGPTRFYRLILLQTANTLTLPPQSNLVVDAGSNVTVTNTATDSNPAALLTYSLLGAPTGATINNTNGVITWTNAMPNGLAARFTTLVTDNSVPQAQATNTFTIFVAPFPAITSIIATSTNVTLQWSAPTNDQFQVQWTTNLTPVITWTLFPQIITSPTGVFTFTDTNAPLLMKFYQLILLP
ncbi:MAG TPA: LamG-like jellyroll fold domain-containing protein [Candidatus Aquilonibacter sp.]|nr:LamG-like jellyroll fold domain-containing protein [Candidatus Aquilonibacter sp.]